MVEAIAPYAALLLVVLLVAGPLPRTTPALAGEVAEPAHPTNPTVAPRPRTAADRRLAAYGLAVVTAVLVLFSGLRYQVGTDFGLNTRRFFVAGHYTLAEAFSISNQEEAFTWLTRMIGNLGGPQTFFFLMAAVTVPLTVLALVGIGDRPGWTLFLYVTLGAYFASFNLVRQALAIALVAFAWRHLDRRRAWCVAAMVAASLIHVTAAPVSLVMLASRRLRPSRRLLAVTAAGSLFVWVAGSAGVIRSEWFAFMNPNWARFDALWEQAGAGTLMELVAVLAVLALTLPWARRAPGPWPARSWSMLLFAAPGLALGSVNSQAPRIALYFLLFAVPLLSLWLSSRRRTTTAAVVTVVVSVGYLLFMLLSGRHSLLPYQLYFFREVA